jgi:hypothetical protein
MKTLIKIALVFLAMNIGLGYLIARHCRVDIIQVDRDAEILSIDEKIFDGSWTGDFLSSSSGSFQSDTVKVGVKIDLGSHFFLQDLRLRHSELAYYKGRKTLPLWIKVVDPRNSAQNKVEFRLNGRYVGEQNCSEGLIDSIIQGLEERQDETT